MGHVVERGQNDITFGKFVEIRKLLESKISGLCRWRSFEEVAEVAQQLYLS